jgi:hypothetical protein
MGKTIWVTERNICLIAAEACRSVSTVKRVLRGQGTDLTIAAVIEAAKRLGLELPAFHARQDGAPIGIDASAVRARAI